MRAATEMPDEAPALLEARGIHTYYGRSHILHGVDIHIAQGEAVALLGRNGMGKTTTIRSLLGLTQPRSGRLWMHGREMSGADTHRIITQGIGYVPEGRGMFPNLTVRESLVMAARPGIHGQREWTLERILAMFPRLTQRIHHLSANLSGGEQQMLAIGRALMTNPQLLILDEATEGLAPLVRRDIWRVIRDIQTTGIASLIVDKNINVLLEITDRGVIMVKGRIVFDGPSVELKQRPALLREHIGL